MHNETNNIAYESFEGHNEYIPRWMPSQFKGIKQAAIDKNAEFDDYTLTQIVIRSISSGLGAALSVAALVILIVLSVMHGGGVHTFCALIFGVPLLLSFLTRTLFEAIPNASSKMVFRILSTDFAFLFIAGSCTPFAILVLNSAYSYTIVGIIWTIAFAGILIESIWVNRPRFIPAVLGLAMCACSLLLLPALYEAINPISLWLLFSALVAFIGSSLFYLFKKRFVFGLFAMIASIGGMVCLFLSICFII